MSRVREKRDAGSSRIARRYAASRRSTAGSASFGSPPLVKPPSAAGQPYSTEWHSPRRNRGGMSAAWGPPSGITHRFPTTRADRTVPPPPAH